MFSSEKLQQETKIQKPHPAQKNRWNTIAKTSRINNSDKKESQKKIASCWRRENVQKDRYQKEIVAVRKIKSIWSFRRSVLDSFSGVLEEKNNNTVDSRQVKGISMKKEDDCSESLCQKRGKNGNWNTLNISYIF